MKEATYLRNLNQIDTQRRSYRNIRVMEGKPKGGCISRVQITHRNGTVKEYSKKEPMEKIIAKLNESKWHQCEGGIQILETQFTSSLGHYREDPVIKIV